MLIIFKYQYYSLIIDIHVSQCVYKNLHLKKLLYKCQ